MFRCFIFNIFLLTMLTLNGGQQDKWIVVTTIQYPTEELKKLALLPDWHLVVVGDKKTPADWHLDNCEYLSVEKQAELGYELVSLLPWNHYSRKNIGYLYAIQNGAQVIYETDDDNCVIDGINLLPENYSLIELNGPGLVINPYVYYGQPSVWPRGFPLEDIKQSSQVFEGQIVNRKIGIQQGLVNKDPDVDAIFRLTREPEVYFENKPPCVIPAGQFCPFNTQNTIFYKSTFWGLYVPSTTAFRVCDIWRGYVVQRLLWEIGHTLCFTSPTAVQNRNIHNFLKDFRDEQDLYLKAGELVHFLSEWKDDTPLLQEKAVTLFKESAAKKFFKDEEIPLIRAWFNDLQKVGYHFPELVDVKLIKFCETSPNLCK